MSNKNRAVIFAVSILFLLLLFGCESEKKSKVVMTTASGDYIDLYVDAVELNDQNEPGKAIDKLNQAIETNDEFSLAYSMMGDIYKDMHEYEASAVSYEKATETNPWSFRDYLRLGGVYELLQKFANAVTAYVKATELKPRNFEANLGAARNYYKIADYENALTYTKMAEQTDPDSAQLQKLIADIYETQGDYEMAIDAYKRALEADSSNPEILHALATAYLRSDRNEAAKELLISVVALQPTNAKAYRHLAYANLQMGEVMESVSNYEKAVEIDDNDWDAHRGLGVAYILQSKMETGDAADQLKQKAIDHWQRSLGLNPQQANRAKLQRLIRHYGK